MVGDEVRDQERNREDSWALGLSTWVVDGIYNAHDKGAWVGVWGTGKGGGRLGHVEFETTNSSIKWAVREMSQAFGRGQDWRYTFKGQGLIGGI